MSCKRVWIYALAGLVLPLGLSSCHQRKPIIAGNPEEIAQEDTIERIPVLLEVENRNWSDLVIFLLVDGKRYRFLQVGAAKDVSREIPTHQQGTMGTLRIEVQRIGNGEVYITPPVSTRTGRTVRLTIESELRRSSIAVF